MQSSLTQRLSACFRHAQLEAWENRVRERALLPPIWQQPLNQRVIKVLRQSEIRCAIPADIIGELVRGDWLSLMGSRIHHYLRDHFGELQVRRADLADWVPARGSDLSESTLSAQGIVSITRNPDDSTLPDFPLDVEQAGFPALLRQRPSEFAYIGLWALDTPRLSPNQDAHHGLLVVDKEVGPDQPTAHVAGFIARQSNSVELMRLDPAIHLLASGRRTASCSLYKVGSLELLHQIERLFQQERVPRAACSTRQDQQADRIVEPLWDLPAGRRFPALVHRIISGTESNANRLIQALKRVSQRLPAGGPGALTARSVIALALELVESTYTRYSLPTINCRFLAHRVMRVAHTLLELRQDPDLQGHTIASMQISGSARHSLLVRLAIWISDILGWFAERFAAKKPLPARLAWRGPEAAGIGGAVLPERSP